MTASTPAENSTEGSGHEARKRFIGALALFLAWVTFLVALGMLSATGPRRLNPSIELERADQ